MIVKFFKTVHGNKSQNFPSTTEVPDEAHANTYLPKSNYRHYHLQLKGNSKKMAQKNQCYF